MIALMQCLIKYGLLQPFGVSTSLNDIQFIFLILSTLCIAAAGNIINDIYDIETDRINKPDKLIVGKLVSEKSAFNLFIALNVIGVLTGFFIANAINKSELFSIFVIVSILLYIYASYLKQTFLIGNFIVSALVSLSILIVGVFDLLPNITGGNVNIELFFFKILLEYALFAFAINFIREIIKDIEDLDGDLKSDMRTMPIVLGKKAASIIAFILTIIFAAAIYIYIYDKFFKELIITLYFLISVIGPLLFTGVLMLLAKTTKDFHQISNILKLVMLFGMLSLLLYQLILMK
jgi:4-hydroxybenzoate polyprenyltransferase